VSNNQANRDNNGHRTLNEALGDNGVSHTIYSLTMPETEAAFDYIIDGGDQRGFIQEELSKLFAQHTSGTPWNPEAAADIVATRLDHEREKFRDMYRGAWTQKQDEYHEAFFDTWKQWVNPIIKADFDQFPYMYPTAGASEALRVAIEEYANRQRIKERTPRIHIFDGEYEGFAAYAKSAGITVVKHDRENWLSALDDIEADEQFYISQPSAIDGNVWDDFDRFARSLAIKNPDAELMLDVTYVGCVAKEFSFKGDHPNINKIFFSLSKPAGAYYHRIGGCLSREANNEYLTAFNDFKENELKEGYLSLFGNKWFKILAALRLGTEIMKRHDVFELPRKYSQQQIMAANEAGQRLGLDLEPSDVLMLATAQPSEKPSDLERYLTRPAGSQPIVRVCLTPAMAAMIDPKLAGGDVKARPHEQLTPKL